MSESTIIPGHDKLSKPNFIVTVNGQDVTMKYGLVSLMISKRVNRIPLAEVVLYDGDAAKRDFELSDTENFIPGKEVTIKGGYGDNPQVIFKGIIIKQSIKAPLKAPSTMILELKDKSIKMTINRKNKYFADKKDSEIIEKIIKDNGLQAEVDTTEASHKEMVQYYSTDWDFIASRAEVNGLLLFIEDGKVKVKKPEFAVKGDSLNLTYGDNIVDAEAEMDARDQYADVISKYWDYSKQEVVERTATGPMVSPEEGNLTSKKLSDVLGSIDFLQQNPAKLLDEEVAAWGKAKLLRSQMSKIKGRIRIFGTHAVKPGDVINLAGMGKRFNGAAFVSSITQGYSVNSPWYSDIMFGYSEEWFYERYDNIVDRPSAGLLPSINGLVTGIVTDIVDQDGGEFRVRVRIPLIDKGDKGVWARIVAADAGNARGILIRPEKDDEVLLGFVNDDPRDPVILGMLYSKKNKVPDKLKPDGDNKMKGWITKGGTEITINDKDQIITVITKGKNSITIDDKKKSITLEDQNKNKMVMDDKGFLLDTPKDINMKAKGKINIEGTNNVTVKSSAQLKAQGTAGAEFSSSGQTAVKGTMLKLN
ncbi:MAG: type VI secretion system tip protein VgrG [Bacteroidetes bacterium]|nr:type VI secretion system tip protein VgrG [Bacteroidota bacterium]